MNKVFYAIIFLLFFTLPSALGQESITFTIPDNSIQAYEIPLKKGDIVDYNIIIDGGSNNDVEFTIYSPSGESTLNGMIYESYQSSITADNSGIYRFEFDNSFSIFSNKQLQFNFEITKRTYYVYVEELPDYADYAEDVMYKSTEFWKNIHPDLNFYKTESPKDADFSVRWVKDFGVEHVGYAFGSQFVEVGLGDSNCGKNWQPYSSNYVSKIMAHEIGHVLKYGHSDNPEDIMYPIAQNLEYGIVQEQFRVGEKYGQFVPICTVKDTTSFGIIVETDDPQYGFDVYFVPSIDSFYDWKKRVPFQHYSDEDCFGEGLLAFYGECKGVSKNSGLLVIMNEKLSEPLTTIATTLQEIPYESSNIQSISYIDRISMETAIQTPPKTESQDISCGKGTIEKNGKCVVDISKQGESGFSRGGGCLIATATYGSELAPQVQQLRELRDNHLLQTQSGTSFMGFFDDFYYSFSPYIADYERENPIFREAVKLAITPMISSLSILNHVNMDSEAKVLGYGISLILLNVGMYVVVPVMLFCTIKNKILSM